jgi:membrane associated rhomboid family serine protease
MTARSGRARIPIATIVLWITTALVTTLQILFPPVANLLQRDRAALSGGQWWRLLTPLLVHPEGWPQLAFDLPSLLVCGAISEQVWGSSRLWLVYFLSGFAGEIAGYAWAPESGGSSVGTAGLLGSLLMRMTLQPSRPPHRLGGVIGLLSAVALTLGRDLHGPPLLVGAVLGAAFVRQRRSQ